MYNLHSFWSKKTAMIHVHVQYNPPESFKTSWVAHVLFHMYVSGECLLVCHRQNTTHTSAYTQVLWFLSNHVTNTYLCTHMSQVQAGINVLSTYHSSLLVIRLWMCATNIIQWHTCTCICTQAGYVYLILGRPLRNNLHRSGKIKLQYTVYM